MSTEEILDTVITHLELVVDALEDDNKRAAFEAARNLTNYATEVSPKATEEQKKSLALICFRLGELLGEFDRLDAEERLAAVSRMRPE